MLSVESLSSGPRFFAFEEVASGLQLLRDNLDVIAREMQAATEWRPWPEQGLYGRGGEAARGSGGCRFRHGEGCAQREA